MKRTKGVIRAPFFFILALAFVTGCTSISPNDYRQAVFVTSNPSGAYVYNNNEFLGTTPGYLMVRRERYPELEFRYPNQSRQIERLKTKYRWWDSFAGNLLLIYAPIGWAIDWYTGTAFDIEDPVHHPALLPERGFKLAIAPPYGLDQETTDLLGHELEEKLKAENKYSIVPYDQSLEFFDYYGTRRTLPQDHKDRYAMLGKIKADAVFLSSAVVANDRITVSGEIKNAYDDKALSERSWLMDSTRAHIEIRKRFGDLFHIIPNTAFINFTNDTPSVTVDNVGQRAEAVPDGSTLGEVNKYVSAVGLSRLIRPRKMLIGRWTFDFVPTINFSSKRLRFQFVTGQDQDFDRIFIGAGYGIEVGYLWKYGFVYFDFMPQLTWTHLAYNTAFEERTRQDTSLTAVSELGYLYFVTDHFVAKLFVRAVGEDTDVWARAIRDIVGANAIVSSAQTTHSGLALGYHF